MVRPDRTLQRILSERDIGAASISLGLATCGIALGVMGIFRQTGVAAEAIFPRTVTCILAGLWAAGMVICTASSLLLDVLYCRAFTVNGRFLQSDPWGHWCCRAAITPWWLMLLGMAAWLPLPRVSALLLAGLGAVFIRLLDLEARLLKQVYRMSLAQGYVIVIFAAVCLGIGIIIGKQLPLPAFPELRILPDTFTGGPAAG